MPDQTDPPRNEDEHNSANRRYADKFGNRIRDTKAAPRLLGPGDHGLAAATVARKPRIELSLTQILGSTAAAVTAAFLGSRLGVAGTLIGAALASVISVVAGAIYTSSIKATRRRVSEAIVAVRSQDDDMHGDNQGSKHDSASQPQLVAAIPLLPVGVGAADALPAAASGAATAPRRWQRPAWLRRPTLRTAVIGGLLTATVFAGALVIVTGYETVSGTAISGGQSGGLTILGGGRVSPGTPTKIPTTTPTSSSKTTGTAAAGTTTAPVTSSATTSSTASTTASTTGSPTTSPSSTGTSAPVIPPTTATSSGTGTSTAASTAPTSGSAAASALPKVQITTTP